LEDLWFWDGKQWRAKWQPPAGFYRPAPQAPIRFQEAASHADPRTTMRYDRARVSLDRHATYIVAAFLAGAAR
jgi:hypothetical protein